VAIRWEPDERAQVEDGIARYPVESNHCAALARIVHRLASPRDDRTRGLQIRPKSPARWIVLKRGAPRWASHTLVETQEHRVDALTGADGWSAAQYIEDHYRFPEALQAHEVDVYSIDPWIEEEG
jgi:hypothetical protein